MPRYSCNRYREENKWVKDISISWKIFLFLTRCTIWTIIGVGITGPGFFRDSTTELKFAMVFVVFFLYVGGNWVVSTLESRLPYATRRLSSFAISLVCIALLAYLFHAHKKYFVYSLSCYYVGAALAFLSLLSGLGSPRSLYKLHDWIVGHFLFLFLYLLSMVCLGVLQTWLLYHNALSSGVAIQDILQYASRQKETGIAGFDGNTIAELRNQVADQERTLRQLMQVLVAFHP